MYELISSRISFSCNHWQFQPAAKRDQKESPRLIIKFSHQQIGLIPTRISSQSRANEDHKPHCSKTTLQTNFILKVSCRIELIHIPIHIFFLHICCLSEQTEAKSEARQHNEKPAPADFGEQRTHSLKTDIAVLSIHLLVTPRGVCLQEH